MTSRECFVYITLPNETEQVVAGRYVQEEGRGGVAIGRFVYARSYLERDNAVQIDPVELDLLHGQTYTKTGDSPMFSALRDASPDAWGRRVIERALGGKPNEIDYLLNSPDDRAGALGFGLGQVPPAPQREFNKTLHLDQLIEAADQLIAGDRPADKSAAEQVQQLQLLGTSMGGARPKAVVEDEDGLWVAKFPRQDDSFDQPRVEHAMLRLAEMAGLQAAHSKLVEVGRRQVLFVKRFDREKVQGGYLRHRMISGLTALGASDSATDRARWSYPLLADQLRRLDVDQKNSRVELFRRMAFNALISNVDDHPRNHALIGDAHGWRLSPAYDLTPTPMVAQYNRSLAMEIGADGRTATAANLVSEAPQFGLSREHAIQVVATLRDLVNSQWYGVCRAQGVTERDCEFIASAFAYEGFDAENVLSPGDDLPSP